MMRISKAHAWQISLFRRSGVKRDGSWSCRPRIDWHDSGYEAGDIRGLCFGGWSSHFGGHAALSVSVSCGLPRERLLLLQGPLWGMQGDALWCCKKGGLEVHAAVIKLMSRSVAL